MGKTEISIKTKSRLANGLLTMGIPFPSGVFNKDYGLILSCEDITLPLWWEARSFWPDGSIKWIFLHTRVPEGERVLRLQICESNDKGLKVTGMSKSCDVSLQVESSCFTSFGNSSSITCKDNDGSMTSSEKTGSLTSSDNYGNFTLNIDDVSLTINSNKWCFRCPGGSWDLCGDSTDTGLGIPENLKYEVTLVEASPIAPLVRIKPAGNISGLVTDQLLRIDPIGRRLIWSHRITWNSKGKYWLKASKAELKVETKPNIEMDSKSDIGIDIKSDISTGQAMKSSNSGSTYSEILIPKPGKVRYDRQVEEDGHPEGRIDRKDYSIWVEKAWQRAPLGILDKDGSVKLSFYPEEADKLGVIGGTSFRHTVHLCCGNESASVAGHDTEFIIDPEYICATGALGQIVPESRDKDRISFPGFEAAFKSALDGGRYDRLSSAGQGKGVPVPLMEEERQDRDYFGLQHYGDWPLNWGQYGAKGRRAYAGNEYDVSYVYFQGCAVFGDWSYMDIARQTSIHMTDVDCISTTGDMRYHGYLESAEDHSLARTEKGDFGHYWTDGFWTQYFFFGDVWAREAAEALTRYLLEYFIKGGDNFLRKVWAVCERNLGWPLVALTATYEATCDNEVLECINKIAAFIERFTADPDSEIENEKGTPEDPIVWWRTAMEDGCKPFMVGIIMEGLERYHRITGDQSAAKSLLNLSDFLIENMWHPRQCDFTYEFNAFGRGHRDINEQQLIPLFLRGLGYAFEITGDEKYREVSEKAFHACLWTLFDTNAGGKEIGIYGRTLGAYVSMIKKWMDTDSQKYLASIQPSDGSKFEWKGGIKELEGSGAVKLVKGCPEYEAEALIAEKDSFIETRFIEPVYTDSGEIEFRVKLKKDTTTYMNQRAYIHLCDEVHTKSCISVITFYTNLSVRIYDNHRKLIETLDGYIKDTDGNGRPVVKQQYPAWKEEEWHTVRIVWEAPGTAVLYMDGVEADRRTLDRPIGGSFKRLHLGYKPGNWKLDGQIELKLLKCGRP